MRRFFMGLAMIAALGMIPGSVRGNDRQITQQIVKGLEERKEEGELRGINIDLEVENGAVYLKGHVASEDQEKIALEVIRHIEGVRQVYNELNIQPTADPVVEPRKASPAKAARATQATATAPVPAILTEPAEEADEAPAPEQDSRELAQRIFARLKQEKDQGRLKGFTLDLEVDGGVAWLKGKVASQEQQNLVLEVVRRVPGVTKVVNGLAVAQQAKSSEDLASQVMQRLQTKKNTGELKDFGLDVQVEEGIVWLSGYVSSEEQKQLVLETARYVPGVVKVVNDMTISAPRQASATQAQTVSGARSARKAPVPPPEDSEESHAGISAPRPLPLQDSPVGSSVAAGATPLRSSKEQPVTFPAQPSVPAPGIHTPQAVIAGPTAGAPQPTVQYVWVPATATPAAVAPSAQVPLAFAPARPANYEHGPVVTGPVGSGEPQPVPLNPSIPATGIAAARFDHPQLPQYAWPSYAPYPNYGAVTYPRQYSPMAWPYIGPFYPYPQVPLGWRKVTLEWDDGWWQLDFKSRH